METLMNKAILFLAVAFLFLACPCPAQNKAQIRQSQPQSIPQDDGWIPADLKPWRGWVLKGQESALCPPRATGAGTRECAFPARLAVRADEHGARFTMDWRMFSEENVPLPYAPDLWPRAVLVDGQIAAVLDDGGVPSVRLTPGEHQLAGTLVWSRIPPLLLLPPTTGLVDLQIGGNPVRHPRLGADGTLELAAREQQADVPEESVQTTVFRLISDGVPMTVTTLARLQVSGRSRTISLDGLLPAGTEPMAVSSPAPVGFGPDGQVMVQAGAGRYDIEITSRFQARVESFGPLPEPFGREIWVVRQNPELRELQVGGLPAMDARTTDLPDAWKAYPAYQADQEAKLAFTEIRRGEAGPHSDDIHVHRSFWLDFGGRGFTAQDSLIGTMRAGWSLAMLGPGELGRAGASTGDLPIVMLGSGLRGVEVRNAKVNLTAESRYPAPGAPMPAAGWDVDASSLAVDVHLPPGWRVFHAFGPDAVSQSWIARWNLLNIFLTLFMVLGAFKLRGALAGVVLLGFLVLAQHEVGAPIVAWLPLLAALALVRVSGFRKDSWPWAAKGARVLQWAALAVLAVLSLVFAASQIRTGVYPQLEAGETASMPFAAKKNAPPPMDANANSPLMADARVNMGANANASRMAADARVNQEEFKAIGGFTRELGDDKMAQAPAPEQYSVAAGSSVSQNAITGSRLYGVANKTSEPVRMTSLEQDPKSLVQTGPGVPAWNWQTVRLTWNGAVGRDQTFKLMLLSPPVTSALCFIRVILLLAALALLAGVKGPWRRGGDGTETAGKGTTPDKGATSGKGASGKAAAASVALLIGLSCALLPTHVTAAQLPSQEILDEFRQKLLQPAECFPTCAGVSEMAVTLDAQTLKITLSAGAATRLVLPLPVVSDGWRPITVTVDNKPADIVAHDGALWVLLGVGPHTVAMAGSKPAGATFSVATPFPVRSGHVDAPGFSMLGLGPDGTIEGGLTFTRQGDGQTAGQAAGQAAGSGLTAVLPPFLEVARTLELGLDWTAVTTVRRLAQTGEPVVVEVPLLSGESVLGQDVRVENGKVMVSLASGQSEISWRSRLDIAPQITLTAPEGVPWVESWRVQASPVWDVTPSGIPAVASLTKAGLWSPLWRPWPGEKVTIGVTRPPSAPGENLTIDQASFTVQPGNRLDTAGLSLRIRSALGGRHVLGLPGEAQITALTLNGKPTPWSSDKPGEVGLVLSPGVQDVSLSWRQPRQAMGAVATPALGLGHAAVNTIVTVDMPRDRWILWTSGDTPLRPAVLFWSEIGFMAVVAFGLGFLPWSPLKRWQWFLLGLGLTQVGLGTALLAVVWLLALGIRKRFGPAQNPLSFNAGQIGLAILVLVGLYSLFEAIHTGLLGLPQTNITGNGSSAYHLAWTFDRAPAQMPVATVYSVSLWWYRGLMLAWSLWLALSLLKWLRFGWESVSSGGAWKAASSGRGKAKQAEPEYLETIRPHTPEEDQAGKE